MSTGTTVHSRRIQPMVNAAGYRPYSGAAAASAAAASAWLGRRRTGGCLGCPAYRAERGEQFDGVAMTARAIRGFGRASHRTIHFERVAAAAAPKAVTRHSIILVTTGS